MATTLWPIVHRLSGLARVKDDLEEALARGHTSKAAVLRTELESTASAIQVALSQWQPILLSPEDAKTPSELARLQSIISNALAYRHSAFVHLFRSIYGYERSHPQVQHHVHISLVHCIGTAMGEGPKGALLWPLFVAACDARTSVDRGLARQSFEAIHRTQGMLNIQRGWSIVQEVWRRADESDSQGQTTTVEAQMLPGMVLGSTPGVKKGGDLWRRVSQDMGMSVVFG